MYKQHILITPMRRNHCKFQGRFTLRLRLGEISSHSFSPKHKPCLFPQRAWQLDMGILIGLVKK